MRTMIRAWPALLLGLLAGAARAGDPASAGAQFLRLGAGARAAGMGDAFTAVADDATALYWNPAGLALLPRAEAVFSHGEQFGTARYETAHAAAPVAALGGTVGIGLNYLAHDAIESVTNTGAAGPSFTPASMALALGYGRRLRLGSWTAGAGGAGQQVRETQQDHSASTFAGDLGAWASHDAAPRWRAGAAARHLGGKEKFLSEAESLPTEAAIGVARGPRDETGALASAELVLPLKGKAGGRAGLEYAAPAGRGVVVFARAGYQTAAAQDLGAFAGVTFGGGARFGAVAVDLGFQSGGELGHKLRLGARWMFGAPGPLR